jgi:DNA-directed RNA polymerase subunit beta
MAETKSIAARERTNFSKIKTAIQIPNLIEVQKNSYERFLQMNMLPEERDDAGLQAVFNSVFPISDFGVSPHWSSSVTPSVTGNASVRT